jgi:ATP-binding cassette, subfamily B, multidrug efflux pump
MARNKFDEDEELSSEKEFSLVQLIRILKYINPYKRLMFMTVVLTLIGSSFALVGPILLKQIIDVNIPNKDINGIIILSSVFFILLIIGATITRITSSNTNKIGQSVIRDLRSDIFDHIQLLPFSYYDSRPHGKILIRIVNYINSLSDLLSKGIVTFITDSFSLIIIIIIMSIINFKLALVAIAGIPLLVFVTFIIKIKSRKAWQLTSAKQSNLNAFIHESISGIKITQSFVQEESNIVVFDKVAEESKKAWLDACKVMFAMQPSVDNIATWTTAFIYIVSVSMLTSQSPITTGVIVAFTSYIWQFWAPIINMANLYNTLVVNMAYVERIFETIDEPIDITDKQNATTMPIIKGHIEFKCVTFGYTETKNILENISFTQESGSTIALVGPTGAGKTTIVNLISRFYDINSGEILVDGVNISDVTLTSLRSQMGIMLQDSFIFSGNIMENIRYGKLTATDDEVIAAAKKVSAHDFISKMEEGYNTEVNERGSRLSVGERQLISFARVLLADPKILILDEATSSIDTKTELILQESLNTLLKGRTSFIIAHRLSTIKNASCIMYVDNGTIMEHGSHDELINKGGLYSKLHESQYTFLKNLT